jgi:hypothetical protein
MVALVAALLHALFLFLLLSLSLMVAEGLLLWVFFLQLYTH